MDIKNVAPTWNEWRERDISRLSTKGLFKTIREVYDKQPKKRRKKSEDDSWHSWWSEP